MVFDGNYIDKAKSAEWSDRLNRMSDEDFELVEAGWKELNPQAGPDPLPEKALDPEYREMRQVIVDAWKSANASPKSYMIDLNVGLALYEFLLTRSFNQIYAETDDWWRFVSLKLCPDLTHMRYPGDLSGRINRKRFFDHPRRIWLKTLWWYVHLSWQGSVESTRDVLGRFGTDTIGQMIERPGPGYQVEVFRAIAGEYAAESEWCEADEFKKVMARHSVYNASFEPTLFSGGVTGYASRLFSDTKKWMKK